jgi:hypothetical protein
MRNISTFWVSSIPNGAKCTSEIKPRIARVKAAINKKTHLAANCT